MSRAATTVALLAILSACAVPRTSTVQERADLNSMLTTVQIALTVMQANKTIEPEEFHAAMIQIADIRQQIEASETKEVGWADIALQVANLVAQWAVGVEPPEVLK